MGNSCLPMLVSKVIDLYLAHLATTSCIERKLKDVAQQHSKHRFSLAELSLDDVMQIDFHAPHPDEVGTTLCPTTYLRSIWDESIKSKRHHRVKHKVRCDKGFSKDAEEAVKKRRERKAPQPETEVIREREKAVQKLVASSTEQRMAMTSQSFHGTPVPVFSAEFVTPETEKAREKIKKQWAKTHSSSGVDIVLGGGSDPASSRKRQNIGQEDWGPSKKPRVPPPLALLDRRLEHLKDEGLTRRNWHCIIKAERFIERFTKYCHHCYIVQTIHDQTLSVNPIALMCRFFGGCLMTEAQIQESAIPGGKLHCIHFKGLMHLPKKIVFSETCKRDPSFSLVIDQVHKAIATKEFKLKVADSEKEVQNDFDKYKVDKGDRSRPWSHLCIAVAHETDYNTTVKFMGKDHKHLVRTMEKILQEWSSVDHMYSCPRSW